MSLRWKNCNSNSAELALINPNNQKLHVRDCRVHAVFLFAAIGDFQGGNTLQFLSLER